MLSSYLSITIYKNYDRKINIELANKDWKIVDNSLENINIFQNKNDSYNELLTRLIIEVEIAEDLSEFIKTEYERLK